MIRCLALALVAACGHPAAPATAIQSELRMHAGHLAAGSCKMAM